MDAPPASPPPAPRWRALLVDDEPDVLTSLLELARGAADIEPDIADGVAAAMALLERNRYDLVVSDEVLGDGRGVDLLAWAGARNPLAVLVLVSAHEDFQMLADAVNRARIHAFVLKPWDPGRLQEQVAALLRRQGEVQRRLWALARAPEPADLREPWSGPIAASGWPPS